MFDIACPVSLGWYPIRSCDGCNDKINGAMFSRSGRIQLWGHAIAVDWAEPEVEVDEDTMATVKILYVRNLMLQTTEETIEKEFNSLKEGTGQITGAVPQGSG